MTPRMGPDSFPSLHTMRYTGPSVLTVMEVPLAMAVVEGVVRWRWERKAHMRTPHMRTYLLIAMSCTSASVMRSDGGVACATAVRGVGFDRDGSSSDGE